MQKKLFLGLLLLFSLQYSSVAADREYAVSKIPLLLLKNSNLVIRLQEQINEIQSLDKVSKKHRFVITILNEEGAKYARLTEHYDKLEEIRSIEGTLYDALGNKIKTLKNKDIEDFSQTSGNWATDNRIKVHNFYHTSFPYTIEYIIEKVAKQTMFLPGWVPLWDEFVSVEKSFFSMKVPKGYLLRYRENNYPGKVTVKEENNSTVYSWQITNHDVVRKEYASPGWTKITPSVFLAPSKFMIEDYTGDMTDWKELGKFQTSLNKGRDVLPEATKQKIAELTKQAVSLSEKTKILYDFLQSTTHYISIQLGIGGWRPFEAASVAKNAYGDCKALSNYMYAILKEAGIRSFYTLIKAGEHEEDILIDFPSRQFNHAILCVPDGKDTIWLECTSQTKAAGYMGSFTGNRHALLITEEGGKLVKTPYYKLNDNQQIRHIKAVLDEEGTLNSKVNSLYTGIQQDDLQMMISELSKDKVKDILHEQFDFATYDVNAFNYKENKSALPSVKEELDLTVRNYATITGKRLFIVPNVMTRNYRKLSVDTARKYDLELGFEYKDVDSVEIELPNGYEPESIPQTVSLAGKFGKYSSSVKLNGNKIIYYRHFEHYSGTFPAKDYQELALFYETIYRADRSRVVLVKK